ncbi:MauE/DoxX family redox-associated membrane protein [Streptosporangium sp. NPDC000239]|uniref:MauE/DoxX family redox-associated membrane protein n=1 Tax=Streptosporangium sp. NPDC000239 TaxID=3154248 RepID=UPI0033285551
MEYVAITMRYMLGVVFLVSSVSKLSRPGDFHKFLDMLRRTGLLNARLSKPVGVVIVSAETVVALLLVTPTRITSVLGAALAVGLLATFTVALWIVLHRGAEIECHCFGASRAALGRRHVVRNASLTLVALVAGVAELSATHPSTLPEAGVVALAGALCGLVVTRLDDIFTIFAPIEGSPRG